MLFVWDAKTPSPERKTFYAKLSGYGGYEGVLREIPEGGFRWVSGSAILVAKEHAPKLRALLSSYGNVIRWHEFSVHVSGELGIRRASRHVSRKPNVEA